MKPAAEQILIREIVSGGQTGVDRGALDAAIDLGLAHGGWCPKGRLAEDGTIPSRYELEELDSPDYPARTEQNVIDSDATLLLHVGQIQGGTLLTRRLARRHGKPCLCVCLDSPTDIPAIRRWLSTHRVRKLNVAGPRDSSAKGIAERARAFCHRIFSNDFRDP